MKKFASWRWSVVAALFVWSFLMAKSEAMTCDVLLGNSGLAPYLESTPGDILATFNAAVLGQLIQTDDSYNLRPGLIQNFSYDYAKKEYVLKLKNGLKFHNGRSVTAGDLEYSLLRGFFSKNSSFYEVYLNNIEGLAQIKPGTPYSGGLVHGVRVIDNLTLAIKLAVPNPSFLHTLTNSYFSLVPREEMLPDNLNWKSIPIGAGPYKVAENGFKNGMITLRLVEPSLLNSPAPQILNLYTQLREGVQFEILSDSVDSLNRAGFVPKISTKPASIRTIFFSNQNELGKNKNFRLAVQLLLDRKAFANTAAGIDAATQILPRHFWGRTELDVTRNLSEAKKLIQKVPATLRGQVLEVAIFSPGPLSEEKQKFGGILSEQFAELGLKITVVPLKEKFPSQQSAKRFAMRIAGRVTDYVDPLIMFASLRSGSPYTYDQPLGDDQKKFDEMYYRAAKAESYEARVETVKALSQLVQNEAIAVAVTEEKTIYYINEKRVISLGNQPQPLTLFLQNIVLSPNK